MLSLNTKKLFLDCEYNGFGGELISIGMIAEYGKKPFYKALTIEKPLDPWVAEHVMPMSVLQAEQESRPSVQVALERYLEDFDCPLHIIADWPEDIAHFCQLCITGPGKRIALPPITFEIIPITYASKIPHNAFYDAVGIWAAYSHRESGLG